MEPRRTNNNQTLPLNSKALPRKSKANNKRTKDRKKSSSISRKDRMIKSKTSTYLLNREMLRQTNSNRRINPKKSQWMKTSNQNRMRKMDRIQTQTSNRSKFSNHQEVIINLLKTYERLSSLTPNLTMQSPVLISKFRTCKPYRTNLLWLKENPKRKSN